jgi:hypothetical protein
MSNQTSIKDVFEKVEFLFERYSNERRATTQPFLLNVVRERVPDNKNQPDDELIREVLMEHVG